MIKEKQRWCGGAGDTAAGLMVLQDAVRLFLRRGVIDQAFRLELKEAMMLLIANDAPLGLEWLDHALQGDWADHRKCRQGGAVGWQFPGTFCKEGLESAAQSVRRGRPSKLRPRCTSLPC